MADVPAPAPQTLNQVNAEFLSNRATRLDGAIAKALESKLPAPKAGKAGSTASRSLSSSAPPSTPASPLSSAPATPPASSPEPSADADTEADALEAIESGADPSVVAADEPQDGAAEAEQSAIDLTALTALAKKKDLRAIEKQLGLEDGILGATNGEYAALRNRQREVEAREKAEAATHEQNNRTLISKFGPTVELIDLAAKGNVRAYALALERTTGVTIAEFVKHYAANVQQMDPRVLELERENARLRQSTAPNTPQDSKAAPASAETALAKANTYIGEEVKTHAALKLKGGLDEVRTKWLASFDKRTQAFKLTPQAAADAVVDDRRKLREQESWLLAGKRPPPPPRTRALSRTGASETQPRAQNLTREQLIERGANEYRRQKAADQRAQRR